jgi:phosphonate transport system permease protein
MSELASKAPPARFERPSALTFVAFVLALALVVSALGASDLSAERLARGLPSIERILRQMVPPDLSRLDAILLTLWQTFLMAVAGATLGVLLSVPLAILAARNLTPHGSVAFLARGLVAFFRTVPDLVWALLFVIAVGLGPPPARSPSWSTPSASRPASSPRRWRRPIADPPRR